MRMRKRNAERKKKGVKVENLIDYKSTDKVDLLGSEMRMCRRLFNFNRLRK